MSRGRKPEKKSFGSDWKGIFKSSVGYYFQSIIVELASRSMSGNDFESNGKLKVKNALPEIEESEKPFEIPESWNWYRLSELCNYGSSSKAEPKKITDSTWVLDLEDIEKETSVLLAKVRFAERNSLSTKSVFKKGDVLYSKLRPYLDKVIVADEDGVCTTEILPLSFSEEINPNFLLLTLKLRSFLDFVNSVTKGMKMPRLGTKEGKKALVPLPSLPEQNKILNFLEDLENDSLRNDDFYFDEEVEKRILNLHKSQLTGSEITTELSHQLELVSRLRQAFLREAMQGKLVPQDIRDEPAAVLLEKIKAEKEKLIAEKKIKKQKPLPEIKPEEIPFEIPNNWTWCRLGDIVNISSGDGLISSRMAKNGKIPVFGGNGITGYHDKFNVEKETIVIGRVGYYCGCVHLTGNKAWITDNAFNVSYSESNLFRDYLIHLLRWLDLGKQQFAGSQPVISGMRVYPKLLPLPPLAEQKRIVEKLEKLMKFCDELEANIRQSATQAETLLQVALKEALEPKAR